ncbi:MAG: Transcriptional regulator, AcrR family [uncultured Thermomicrobiales bacterium]|uniref:Transcriptional regulator, AcrR family n=1 Tax=uncultured Thermomicrobiales bacterium TaxID=1645740 RepID=A0A6J4ULN5_9BACT|nr:MAG: Transcriptional regulator, AcrR family [uncultured Thermomicrobiales bacterium]
MRGNASRDELHQIGSPGPGVRTGADAVSPATRDQVRERIVEAATGLLHHQGPEAVTTRAVATRAGVQAPTIYRLFGDKDGLLRAVAERAFAAYVADKAGQSQTDDPVADLRAGWEAHLGFGLANPDLFTVLSTARHVTGSPASVTGMQVLRRRVERIAAAGRLRVPVPRAVQMIHAAGTGAVLTLLAVSPEDRDPGLGDAVYDALVRAITTDHAAGSEENAGTRAAITLTSHLPILGGLSDAERGMMTEWLDRIVARTPERDAGQ